MKDNERKKKENNKVKKDIIGGMALFSGLMLRNSKKESISEFDSDSNITVQINNIYFEKGKKFEISKLPIIRGIISLINTISSSMPYITTSAQNFLHGLAIEKKDESLEKDISVDKFEFICGFVISVAIILSLFTLIPNLIATFFPWNFQNIIQCIIQILIILIYLGIMAKSSLLQKLFEYHGAEHKVVNAYEHLKEEEITVENVKKESRFHIRCGGNFVIYLFLLIVITTLLIPPYNILFKSLLQVILFPLYVGVAYEIVMISDRLPGIFKYLAYPAMAIQFITTKEPTDDKIELAIYGLFGLINDNNSKTASKYINEYVSKNLHDKEYDKNDIFRVISHVKGINISRISIECENIILTYNEQIKIDRMLNKIYKENIPLQYVIGKQAFFNEEYIVTPAVLIPRSDSEILVEKAIEYINKFELKYLIDMCTGSGCIGISIAKNANISEVYLVDISSDALAVTLKNMKLNNVDHTNEVKKVFCVKSDLFEIFLNKETKYDMIVSNPPYIKNKDINSLSLQVQKEPLIALDGGKTGLDFYIKIFNQALKVLKPDGIIMVEIGYDEKDKVLDIISKHEEYEVLECIKDYGDNDRVIVCRFHHK